MSFQPLAGIRVVDVTTSYAGPFCSELLGALGADVVKVEAPDGGDPARTWGPPFWSGQSAIFLSVNAGKRSLAVDLRRGRDVLLRLADSADVFLQSLRPGLAEELGLGPEELRRRNPRLVYCSIGAFGRVGPWSEQPGFDPLMQAAGGIISVTGEPARPGVRVGVSLVDQGTGMWAAIAILAAVHERERSGQGREVDVSLYETALGYMAYHLTGAGHAAESHGARADQPRLAAQKDAALAQEHAGGDVADQRRRRLVTRPAPGGEVEVDEAAADLGVVLARGAAGHQQIAEVD